MNYKPLIRRNKRTLKDLSAMVLWLFILILLIQYTARAENINASLGPAFKVPDGCTNGTVMQMLLQNKTLICGNTEKAVISNIVVRK